MAGVDLSRCNPVVPQDYKVVQYYLALDPGEDFVLKTAPVSPEGPTGEQRTKGAPSIPLPMRLVETYVDLGLAITANDWRTAYRLYRYLGRMIGNLTFQE